MEGYISFSQRFRNKLMLYKFAPFLDSNRDGCRNCTINWKTAYHYALDTQTGFFGQLVSTLGDFLDHIQLLVSCSINTPVSNYQNSYLAPSLSVSGPSFSLHLAPSLREKQKSWWTDSRRMSMCFLLFYTPQPWCQEWISMIRNRLIYYYLLDI